MIADGEGISISKRRITLSTSGVVPQIERLGLEANAMLAISLHAVRDELRDELVPLAQAILSSGRRPHREVLEREYPVEAQEAFGRAVATANTAAGVRPADAMSHDNTSSRSASVASLVSTSPPAGPPRLL